MKGSAISQVRRRLKEAVMGTRVKGTFSKIKKEILLNVET